MTPGASAETADGMSEGKIEQITGLMRCERYRFAPAALAGGAAAAVKSPITIWQVQARSQARAAGRLRTWRASMRDSSSAVAAADPAALVPLGAPAGVGGVRALVDGRAPQGGVAFAVGRVGGVGGGGVDAEVVGVDLDLR